MVCLNMMEWFERKLAKMTSVKRKYGSGRMKIHFIIRTFKGWGVPAKVSTLCKIKTNINTRMTEFPHHVTCKRCKKIN